VVVVVVKWRKRVLAYLCMYMMVILELGFYFGICGFVHEFV
jgi:hypothetical protein